MASPLVPPLPLFIVLAWILLVAPAAHAENMRTEATVQNTPPALLSWQAHWDPIGAKYTYAVAANDGNGVEDLTAVHILLRSADGTLVGETTDPAVEPDGRRAAHWAGTVTTDGTPVVAELILIDAAGDSSRHVGPVVPLDVPTGPAVPLAQDIQTATAASAPLALGLGLLLLGRARRQG